jgi:anthranilate/para-aminobenzoate synthase component I
VTVLRAIAAPADPMALAAALSGRPGVAVLASRPSGAPRPDDARFSFVACEPVEACDDIVPPDCTTEARGFGGAPAAPRWIGVVPYDALRCLERPAWTRSPDDRPPPAIDRPAWRRYAAIARVDHFTGAVSIEADDAASASALARPLARARAFARPPARPRAPAFARALALAPALSHAPALAPALALAPHEPDEAHVERVRAALRLIAAGDLYQVNLARRISLRLRGDALSLFASLLDAAPAPWGYLHDLGETLVAGASPELALSVRGDAMRTCPIKGTRPRGSDAAADAHLAVALGADPKERAELTMAIDVHRNDLGRVAVPGSVRVLGEPRVIGGRTVWSRVAEVVARRAAGVTLADVARAMLPCGSVTGAPKTRAMEVIATLEPWRRGAYTGAFGYVGRDGALVLAMAIRTLELARDGGGDADRDRDGDALDGCYFTGGGIVADSDPGRELEETRWKASQLAQLGA